MKLSQSELKRYNRQMLIDSWGTKAQMKLKSSSVAVVGVGGLGCTSSTLLAAAGVGRLRLIDRDKTSLSDLNRQVLYTQNDLGKFKAETAKKRLRALNPEVEVEAILEEATMDNVSTVIGEVNTIVDGLDNWKTRFIINDFCVANRIPFVHAGVSQLYGQITTVVPGKGPCLRCIFSQKPTEAKVNPVFGGTPSVLASLQAAEAIKIIAGIGKPLVGRMLFVDEEEMIIETLEIKKNPNCPTCSGI
jgi:molybdopterin/thiamine biosynthesis adenylyltransferase